MIETISDFLSIFALLNIIFVFVYYLFQQYSSHRKRKIIEKELEYYRVRD